MYRCCAVTHRLQVKNTWKVLAEVIRDTNVCRRHSGGFIWRRKYHRSLYLPSRMFIQFTHNSQSLVHTVERLGILRPSSCEQSLFDPPKQVEGLFCTFPTYSTHWGQLGRSIRDTDQSGKIHFKPNRTTNAIIWHLIGFVHWIIRRLSRLLLFDTNIISHSCVDKVALEAHSILLVSNQPAATGPVHLTANSILFCISRYKFSASSSLLFMFSSK